MLKFILVLALAGLAKASEADLNWCNITKMDDKPLTFDFDITRFQAFGEKITDYLGAEEIYEWYDGVDNIAVATQTFEGVTTKTWLYGKINELLIMTKNDFGLNVCAAKPLDLFWEITPFYLFTIDKEKHIVSGLNFLLLMKAQLTYIGKNVVRGISVDDWQLCYYNEESKSTQLMTLSINDDTWTPAEYPSEYKNIPVQTTILTQANAQWNETMTTVSITEFKPYLLMQEEDYFVPTGTFCTDRINIAELPAVPRYFEFFLEGALSATTNGMLGGLTKTREFYDFDAKLFKMQSFKGVDEQRPVTELHDYNTGLVYTIDEFSGNCTTTQIDPNGIDAVSGAGGFTNIRNPEKFFDFEGVDYQFSANRRINGVNTGSWIGKQKFKLQNSEFDSTFEWSFLTGYNRTDDLNTYAPTPVRLVITQLIPVVGPLGISEYLPVPWVYNFVNFRISDSIAAHHDISQCENPGHVKTFQISFETTKEVVEAAKKNPETFKLAAYKAVHKSAKVAAIRIQKFKVLPSGAHIFFVFDIMEKSEFYGNVKVPLDDVSLEDAEYHLGDSVSKNDLHIDFKTTDKTGRHQEYFLTANPFGFASIENQDDGFTVLTTVTHPKGYSGATVGVVSSVVAITMLVVVFALLVLHKNGKITLPGLPK